MSHWNACRHQSTLGPIALAVRVGLSAVVVLSTAALISSSSHGASPVNDSEPAADDATHRDPDSGDAIAIFAGGCFWCTEAVFERMVGVKDVESGYIGGRIPNPTYKAVCTGRTGHAEAVRIRYNPEEATFDELLEVFFKTHDPTTLNRQGNDIGTQYRSSVFYLNEGQKQATEKMIDHLNEADEFNRRIVTRLEEATEFYPAEEYHQDYYRLNPNAGYCRAVVASKVRKFNNTFGDKIKPDAKAGR